MAKEGSFRSKGKPGAQARSKKRDNNQSYCDSLGAFLAKNPRPEPNDILAFWRWDSQILWFERPAVFTGFWTRVESSHLLSRLSQPVLYPPEKLHPIMFLLRDIYSTRDEFHGASALLFTEAVRHLVGAQQCFEVAAGLLRHFNPRVSPPSFGPTDLRSQINGYRQQNRRAEVNVQRQRFYEQVRARTTLSYMTPPSGEPRLATPRIYRKDRKAKVAPNPAEVLAFWRWYTGEILWPFASKTFAGFWKRAAACDALLSLCRVGGAPVKWLHPVFWALIKMWSLEVYGSDDPRQCPPEKRVKGRPKGSGPGPSLSALAQIVRQAVGERGPYWQRTSQILTSFFPDGSWFATQSVGTTWEAANLRGCVNYHLRVDRAGIAEGMSLLVLEAERITSKREIARLFSHISRQPA